MFLNLNRITPRVPKSVAYNQTSVKFKSILLILFLKTHTVAFLKSKINLNSVSHSSTLHKQIHALTSSKHETVSQIFCSKTSLLLGMCERLERCSDHFLMEYGNGRSNPFPVQGPRV